MRTVEILFFTVVIDISYGYFNTTWVQIAYKFSILSKIKFYENQSFKKTKISHARFFSDRFFPNVNSIVKQQLTKIHVLTSSCNVSGGTMRKLSSFYCSSSSKYLKSASLLIVLASGMSEPPSCFLVLFNLTKLTKRIFRKNNVPIKKMRKSHWKINSSCLFMTLD